MSGLGCGRRALSFGVWDPVPWPGIEPWPPVLGVQSLSHWITREVPGICFWAREFWPVEWIYMSGFYLPSASQLQLCFINENFCISWSNHHIFPRAGLEFLWPWCCFCLRGLTDNTAKQLKNSPGTTSLWRQRSAPLSPGPTCPGTGALPSWPPVPRWLSPGWILLRTRKGAVGDPGLFALRGDPLVYIF